MKTKTEYECGALTVVRALDFNASGYHFGSRTAAKGKLLRGKPLLLGTRLCPPPPLPDAISGFVVVDENMPGAYEVEIPCSDGVAIAHIFLNGAVTLAVTSWQCAFEAYDKLVEAARLAGSSAQESPPSLEVKV
ncbi:MAG: hypothetical protein JZD41_09375 [Thermoproteus sp.]|nr:hypothetical protein [Thermoproteus sp.]